MTQKEIRLLLVEDNPKDARDLEKMLGCCKRGPYAVELADRLATAYRKLAGGSFDLLLLDLFLPESKGLGTLKKVKAKSPGTPIVALTRFDDEQTGMNAVREGAQDYLVKGQFDGNLLERSIYHAIERHRGEEALRLKNIELEVLNQKLMEADRLKSVFVANMSHELRTPLNSVIGFTSIILKGMSGPVTPDQKKQLAMVKKNGQHLLQLINDVLDVSKIEAGKIELSFDRFLLSELLTETLAGFRPELDRKNLTLTTNLDIDPEMISDRIRLKQILLNLTNNAVKFTDRGGITIAACHLKNQNGGTDSLPMPNNRSPMTHKHLVQISVADTGIGIREEDMDKLFIPFHQLDMSMTKTHQGTGLGLHLSQKMAHLLGGHITARSLHGKGSRFTLTLPVKHEEGSP